jgi:hypothetical protein
MNLDQRLADWKSGLPTGLAILTSFNIVQLAPDPRSEAVRFQVILSLRYHSLCMLQHRKILEWLLVSPESTLSRPRMTEYLWTVIQGSIDMCTHSARDTVVVISTLADHQILLPIWWYSVYYGTQANIVLGGVTLTVY